VIRKRELTAGTRPATNLVPLIPASTPNRAGARRHPAAAALYSHCCAVFRRLSHCHLHTEGCYTRQSRGSPKLERHIFAIFWSP
jgi:hypothetical protein